MKRAVVFCVLVACGGPVAPIDAGSEWTIAAPAGPAPPMPPAFVCPDGWRQRELDGASMCEPWKDDTTLDCDGLAIPGVGCEAFDTCPADGWPLDLPSSGVVYVRAGAIDGDGSRGRPFATLAEGFASGAAIVAL